MVVEKKVVNPDSGVPYHTRNYENVLILPESSIESGSPTEGSEEG